jgi:hypothetical protein
MQFTEFLIEKIELDENIHKKLSLAFKKWMDYVNSMVPEDLPSYKKAHWIESNKKEIEVKLRQYLSNIIQKVVKDNATPIDDENFEGYKISISINIETGSSMHGAIHKKWVKQYTQKPKYIMRNTLILSIAPYTILMATSEIDDLISTVTHEITHIIQSLRHAYDMVHTKPFQKRDSEIGFYDQYYINKSELDAHATGVASAILLQAQKNPDRNKYIESTIKMLKLGISSLFNTPTFPNRQYVTIQEKLKEKTNNKSDNMAKEKAWKYFNKKIISRLMPYLEK